MTRIARPVPTASLVLGGALAAWIITVDRMRGMDAGPGTDLGGLGWYVGIWVTMMLPSAAPMMPPFARVAAERRRRGQDVVSTPIFVAGYIGVWALYGLGAYGLYRAIVAAGTGFLAWDRAGPYIVGVAIAAAGVYELTPLKSIWVPGLGQPDSDAAQRARMRMMHMQPGPMQTNGMKPDRMKPKPGRMKPARMKP